MPSSEYFNPPKPRSHSVLPLNGVLLDTVDQVPQLRLLGAILSHQILQHLGSGVFPLKHSPLLSIVVDPNTLNLDPDQNFGQIWIHIQVQIQ